MADTIDITPQTNDERVSAYAEKHQTSHPWDHVSGQLTALSELASDLSSLEERLAGDELAWAFVNRFQQKHREVSNEFLSLFGQTKEEA